MRNFKTGFSLAEVLIALGIVAVIATMGFSISKRNIEHAYDLYIYTGYQGLSDAISDANAVGLEIVNKDTDGNQIPGINEAFANHLRKVLGIQNNDNVYNYNSNLTRLTAPNGIEYSIEYRYHNSLEDTIPENRYYYIRMLVPSARTRSPEGNILTQRRVIMVYSPQKAIDILIPLEQPLSAEPVVSSTFVDIQNRMDLLPTYIDDGVVGRYIPSNDPPYQRREFRTFKESYCLTKNELKFGTQNIVRCTGIANPGSVTGALSVISPRAVR